jgi:protein dithiol oxidoreductase (disulfide-forming)
MNPTRRSIVAAGTLAALGFRNSVLAQAQAPVAGRDYVVMNPSLPVETPGKLEVLEFFWYGCIHCYNLEPALETWLKALPADAAFHRIPAVFNDRWAHDAAIFYTFEALGLTAKTHAPLFDAIHKSRLNTANEKAFTEWLRKQSIDEKKFQEAFRSFGVQSKTRRATQLTAAYRIDGTPALAVNGTYTISAEQGGSARGMFVIADHLIGLARKAPAAKK